MIPAAYASEIDDASLGVDDSSNLIEDTAIDSSSSYDLKQSGFNQEKESITQDELLEDSDAESGSPAEDSSLGPSSSGGDSADSTSSSDGEGSNLGPSSDGEDDEEYSGFDDGDYSQYNEDENYDSTASSLSNTDDPYAYYWYLPYEYPYVDLNHTLTQKTILEPNINQTSRATVSARFLDKNGRILKNTYVIFLVDHEEFKVKTDENGIATLDVMRTGDFFFAIINPVTGDCYIFPERMRVYFYAHVTTGFRHNGNTHMFTVNSQGFKSTIKNENGIVSKAVTYSKDKVIISTKTNDSIDQIVIEKSTRYAIYLIAILCILLPIGFLRYRKK